jgi:branched-chain amino acid transport system ATP-binding protein
LIGPNGAGKSTYFKLLSGFFSPDKGEIIYNNQNITKLLSYKRLREGIGLKFQIPRVYFSLTVQQNLDIPWSNSDRNSDINYEMVLELSHLKDKLEYIVKELPHGQMQWLEICMVLRTKPIVLLLDEPTAGMTHEETYQTAEIVKKLNKKGLTIIVIEHDMEFVKKIAKTITVFHQGKVFAQGNLDEIISNNEIKRIYLGEV